jgi:phosphoribosylaminoimidazolecarboxamide formyltransferase / IMP cyclohydrolase
MNEIKVKNIFAAVFNKSILDPVLEALDPKSVKFWGTEGTVNYLKSKGFRATSVVSGFDFDGRVKSLDKLIFARILADRTNGKHLQGLKHLSENTPGVGSDSPGVKELPDEFAPFDLVVVDLYAPNPKTFPESMDIGGQALIRAAIKNYKNVGLAFDEKSIEDLARELKTNKGSTDLKFRKKQAAKALKFIADRGRLEMNYEL